MRRVAITTVDNPFDPIERFDDWLMYDRDKGYGTCAYLGRVTRDSDRYTDAENERAIEDAIDEIIRYDPFNIYRKIVKEIPD